MKAFYGVCLMSCVFLLAFFLLLGAFAPQHSLLFNVWGSLMTGRGAEGVTFLMVWLGVASASFAGFALSQD